jgi:hypothetical protein
MPIGDATKIINILLDQMLLDPMVMLLSQISTYHHRGPFRFEKKNLSENKHIHCLIFGIAIQRGVQTIQFARQTYLLYILLKQLIRAAIYTALELL